jgi:hypothetical protein
MGDSEKGLLTPTDGLQITELTPVIFTEVLPPTQIAVSPLNRIVGRGFTKTVTCSVEIHPFALVIFTEYTVVEVGLTEIVGVVAPLFQAYEIPPVAVKIAPDPEQMV